MTQIVLNVDALNRLQHPTYPVEICDPSGRILGRFVPTTDASEWEQLTPHASEEELARRLQAGERRYTTAEVLAHLEKL